MSNITIQRAGELLRSVFEILWDKPDGLTARQILSLLPQVTRLTAYELEYSQVSGTPKYEKFVRITTIPLAHAGWLLKNEKGRWYITEAGYRACKQFTNVQEFYQEALRLYNEHKRIAPESIMALEIAQESAWAQIEKHLLRLKNTELQIMTSDLLRCMGYFPSWMAPPEKQRGHIDLIAFTDPLGVRGHRIVTQIIQKGQSVTLEGVKGFLPILGPRDFGMIISISGFTRDAAQELSTEHFEKVTALDANAFFELWKKYYAELSQETRYLMPVEAVHFLSHFD
ncbi:MAG: restriction endonuclease [Anaerolineales bacterium]|nr:restriction endonuclease [Anaerolineales bacterium]